MERKINETYYIDTDFDYRYSNSWMGHKKYFYGLYRKNDNRTRTKIREYKDLDAICCSLISKFNNGVLKNTTYEDIKLFVNKMIDEDKVKRKVYLK